MILLSGTRLDPSPRRCCGAAGPRRSWATTRAGPTCCRGACTIRSGSPFVWTSCYPDGDVLGTDLASTLRRNQYGGPIVIQSANAEPSDCITYADAGADGTLAKGVLAATSASDRPSRRSRPRPRACRRPLPRLRLRRRRSNRRPVRRWPRVPWAVKSATATPTTIRPRTRRTAARLRSGQLSPCSTPCDDHDSFPSTPSPIISVPPPARVPRRLPFLRLQKQLQNDR